MSHGMAKLATWDCIKVAIEDEFLSIQKAEFGINGVWNLSILSSMRTLDQLVKITSWH